MRHAVRFKGIGRTYVADKAVRLRHFQKMEDAFIEYILIITLLTPRSEKWLISVTRRIKANVLGTHIQLL